MPISVLLSIQPEFVEAIFGGAKHFEYRRMLFRRDDVRRVVVYASTPVKRVVGEFEVVGVLSLHVPQLWKKTRHAAGIDRERFYAYFHGRPKGHAIKIGRRQRFAEGYDLAHFGLARPPQSFQYLAHLQPMS